MTRLSLEAADDHVEALAHEGDPVRAVLELIWNSLDADAHQVTVELDRADGSGVVGVRVTDDGHGISPEAATSAFKWIGGSWKRTARKSLGEGRPLHGKSGQGRLRAFALGTDVRWRTVARDTAGRTLRTQVVASSTTRNDFDLSEPIAVSEAPGTTFEASGRQGLDRLEQEPARLRIVATLAPYLIAHPGVSVTYDGSELRPADNILADTQLDLSWEHQGATSSAHVRVIEWREAKSRSMHLCDESGVPVDEIDGAPAPDFRYSAYVLWAGMPEHRSEWLIAPFEEETSVVGALIKAARNAIEEHFEGRRAQRRREAVAEWKAKGTYPYSDEELGGEIAIERATFDVVATAIGRHIPAPRKQQKLVLGLLRESLEQRPSDVTRLLDQFLGLPTEEREQLDHLLTHSGLSQVIRATTSVTNRLDFLRALELMVFDPEANGLVGERAHLHKILESELWIFGEEYNLMASEVGLTAALERHRARLGPRVRRGAPVRRLDGTSGRLDLLLSAAATEHDRTRHLVVELKAPKVVASGAELAQVKSYAKAVAADARFVDTKTTWDFWLVTSTMDDDVRAETIQRGRPRGLVYEPDDPALHGITVRVWVKTWGELIDDGKRRLEYFRANLRSNPSMDDARRYLATHHADVIPAGLLADPEGVGTAPELRAIGDPTPV